MPYNPLEMEVIKKVIKQTLYLKKYAHPNKVPFCKINVFFNEFYHKKKCDGILFNGELNDETIIVCKKCIAVNFYERFIWTCEKCGNQFRDENENKNYISDKSDEIKKRSDNKDNFEEDISPSSNSSNNKYSRDSKKNKIIHIKETNPFDLEKNNQKMTEYVKYKINIEDRQIKKSILSKFKRKINNIYYEREKEKREKKKKKKKCN